MTSIEAGIVTDDIDSLRDFYIAAFAFQQVSDHTFPQGRVCRLRRDDAALKLYRPSSPTTARSPDDPWHQQRGFAYAALHVDDADAAVHRAVQAGAVVVTPVTAHRPGARFALLADPQGNMWEILEEHPQP